MNIQPQTPLGEEATDYLQMAIRTGFVATQAALDDVLRIYEAYLLAYPDSKPLVAVAWALQVMTEDVLRQNAEGIGKEKLPEIIRVQLKETAQRVLEALERNEEMMLNPPKAKPWFTVIIQREDEAEEKDTEALMEGIPAGYGYLSTLLEAPDFVRLEFQTGLTHTTIIRME